MRILFLLASLLVLPLALLLFAQWPLRDLVQAYSRQTNDAAQVIFALYMAIAVTAATRARAHLSAHPAAAGTAPAGWRTWALLACVLPWSLFMLWAAWPQIEASVATLEKFGETLTPGFFLIKLSLGLMLLLIVVDALGAARSAWRARS